MNKVEIPKIIDDAKICVIEGDNMPFNVRRIYYIVDAKEGEVRGMHAHYQNDQVLFCLKGRVRMVLDDGFKREEILLDNPETGIRLPPMIWHEMHEMNEETVLLVLASEEFDETDYIRDYHEFLKAVRED